MKDDKKIALMFSLAEEQQKNVQDLIKDAKEIQSSMNYNALEAAKIAVKAVGDSALIEVKDKFKNYENNLENLIAKGQQANQTLEIAANKLNNKLILSFSIFAFSCIVALLGVSFWLSKTIQEQRQTIAILEEQGGDFQFSNCGGKICIKVEDTPQYTDGYRIIVR